MSNVVNLRDRRLTKAFEQAVDLLGPLAEFAVADSATAMAAAAFFIGYQLAKDQDHARLRGLIVEMIDDEIVRNLPKPNPEENK